VLFFNAPLVRRLRQRDGLTEGVDHLLDRSDPTIASWERKRERDCADSLPSMLDRAAAHSSKHPSCRRSPLTPPGPHPPRRKCAHHAKHFNLELSACSQVNRFCRSPSSRRIFSTGKYSAIGRLRQQKAGGQGEHTASEHRLQKPNFLTLGNPNLVSIEPRQRQGKRAVRWRKKCLAARSNLPCAIHRPAERSPHVVGEDSSSP